MTKDIKFLNDENKNHSSVKFAKLALGQKGPLKRCISHKWETIEKNFLGCLNQTLSFKHRTMASNEQKYMPDREWLTNMKRHLNIFNILIIKLNTIRDLQNH